MSKTTKEALNSIAVTKSAQDIYYVGASGILTLSESIDSDDSTITISGITEIPAGTIYFIDNELVKFVKMMEKVMIIRRKYLVSRGYNGTVATSHSALATLDSYLTSLSDSELSSDIFIVLDTQDPSFYDVLLEVKVDTDADNSGNSTTIDYAFCDDELTSFDALDGIKESLSITFPNATTKYYQTDVIRPKGKYMYIKINSVSLTANVTFSMKLVRV